jgi:hypothetical protein
MWEVADGTGGFSGNHRYADAVVVGLWKSNGRRIEGFEIKVSRSDWRRELKDPTKSHAVARFCDTWWVVAPSVKEVPVDTLPPGWGLLTLDDSGELRQRVAPSVREPEPIGREFLGALLRRGRETSAPISSFKEKMRMALATTRQTWRRSVHCTVLGPLSDFLWRHGATLDAERRQEIHAILVKGFELSDQQPSRKARQLLEAKR